jgi:putative YphP/YqiW family bacilliredoxin
MLAQRYPEQFLAPMREELTSIGFEELRTTSAVDEAIDRPGTLLIVVNSICGCAAGKARPALARAVQHDKRPERLATVFAGGDIEATARAREYFAPYPPSSPSIALMKDGKLVFMMERRDIESRSADQIVSTLHEAFERHCGSSR